MAELATLARPYARAAFEAAREDGDDGLDRWSRMLALLAAAVEQEAVADAIVSPSRTPEGKAQMIVDLLGDDLSDKGRNLVRLLAENKRLELTPEIAPLYEELKDAFLRTLEVEVVSAREISQADLDALSEKLAARFDKQIALTSRIDPSLLGGAVIRAGDEVIDGSIRGRLDRLADTLRARV
ncbi:MAG: F0F1 ATP synthase subunit delta [Pseudomonadales bacterium]|jgi:F-type H+-transporting ATPase subunit delta|nr:F0F1 ATP synthase subunit delta [Pseudomonadales bacterium]